MAIPVPTINAIASITGLITRHAATTETTIMVAIPVGTIAIQMAAITTATAIAIQTTGPATLSTREAIGMGVRRKSAAPCAITVTARDMSLAEAGT